mgnify:CR=1 FL=1
MTRLGFIGLGNMGGSMALNVLKGGHELIVHDLRRELAVARQEQAFAKKVAVYFAKESR